MHMSSVDAPRVLMIGLDAMDLGFIESSIDDYPTFKQLTADGAVKPLDGPGNTLSAAVWPTFYTGKDPGEHGFYYPMQWDPDEMRLRRVTEDWFRLEPFWYELSRHGLPVTAFDVPTAFPSRIPNGAEIVNWGAQSYSDLSSHPDGLHKELIRRFGRNPMRHDAPLPKTERGLEKVKRICLEGTRAREAATRWLMAETDWRLFITTFVEGHRAGHYLWPHAGEPETEGRLKEVYQAIDRSVAGILDDVDLNTTTVVLFAAHGMGPNNSQMHFVAPVMDRVNAAFQAGGAANFEEKPVSRSLMRRLREGIPTPLQNIVASVASDKVRDWVVAREFCAGVDWAKTPGTRIPAGLEGYIRLNLKGRERDGYLEPGSEDHRRYVDLVRDSFLGLTVAGTNQPLVKDVLFPGDIFSGPKATLLPDISFVWAQAEPVDAVVSDRFGTIHAALETGRVGNHTGEAFAIIAGHIPPEQGDLPLERLADLSRFVSGLLDTTKA